MSQREDIEGLFRQTLEDGRLSRAEKRALSRVFADLEPSQEAKSRYLSIALGLAKEALERVSPKEALDWLVSLSKLVLRSGEERAPSQVAEVLFEPRDDVPARLASLIDRCQKNLDICVFTVTDNRISGPISVAHRRGVRVRVITDDTKSTDRGSDIVRLAEGGIEVRFDHLPNHMHHKFAIFDGRVAVTGSYNWTRGAAELNHENLLITDDLRLIHPYAEEFERLWQQFARLK